MRTFVLGGLAGGLSVVLALVALYQAVDRQAERDYRWNFLWNVGDGVFFWFGLSFISSTTILPLFVSKLSGDPFWIALLGVLSAASWYLPQLFTAGATERLARKKPVVITEFQPKERKY